MEEVVEKKFKCEICEKSFSSKTSQDHHISRVHGEEKLFICNVCTKSFKIQPELTMHIANNHQQGKHHICKHSVFGSIPGAKPQ